MHNAVTRGREKGRLSRFRHLQFLEALSLGTRVSLPGRCIASTSQGNSRDVKYRVLLCLIPRSPTKNANPLPIVTGHNPVTLASNCVFLALTLIFLPILSANSAPHLSGSSPLTPSTPCPPQCDLLHFSPPAVAISHSSVSPHLMTSHSIAHTRYAVCRYFHCQVQSHLGCR